MATCVPKLVAMATSLGTCEPPSNTWFPGPTQLVLYPSGISIGSAVFAQMTAKCPYTLQWDDPSPQICPFPWGIWTPSNTWFLGPTRVLSPNGISIGAAGFAGLTSVTDRQTIRQTDRLRYSVGNDRPHLRIYVVLRCGLIIDASYLPPLSPKNARKSHKVLL